MVWPLCNLYLCPLIHFHDTSWYVHGSVNNATHNNFGIKSVCIYRYKASAKIVHVNTVRTNRPFFYGESQKIACSVLAYVFNNDRLASYWLDRGQANILVICIWNIAGEIKKWSIVIKIYLLTKYVFQQK